MTCPYCYVIDDIRPDETVMKMIPGEQTTAGYIKFEQNGVRHHHGDRNRYSYMQECARGHVFAVRIRGIPCQVFGCKDMGPIKMEMEFRGVRCQNCEYIGHDVRWYKIERLSQMSEGRIGWIPPYLEKTTKEARLCKRCLPVFLQETSVDEGAQ